MKKFNLVLLIILVAAFVVRLLLVFSAYHGDLNNNISWGKIAYENGFDGFYGSDKSEDWPYSAPNQPPLYILLFAFIAFVYESINKIINSLNNTIGIFPSGLVWFWEEKGMTLLVKLPGIIADLAIAIMIYQYIIIRPKLNNKKIKALLLSTLWLFNPVIIYSSAVWGQTDSLVNALGFTAIILLLNRNLIKFVFLFTLSLLFKGSLAIFFPLLVFMLLKQKLKIIELFKALMVSLITVFTVSVWFHPHVDFVQWFINLYTQRILPGEIGYLTANAFNLWWLIDSGKVYDSVVYFGLPARIWGFIFSLGLISFFLYFLYKRYKEDRVWLAFALSALITFLFMTRIHERYLYPYFFPATLLIAYVPATIVLYIVLSIAHLFNLYHLFWLPDFPIVAYSYDIPFFVPFLISIQFIVLVGYLVTLIRAKR